MANQLRVNWPTEQLCNSCFYTAMRTRGTCPICGHDGVLPGRLNHTDPRPVCLSCASIPGHYRCATCHTEGQIYRAGQCARCALREDLTALMIDGAAHPATMSTIVTILCEVDRPESILSWKRSPTVRALLTGLAGGDIPLSHDGLDAAGQSRQVSHLRSLLEHHGLLPKRDEPLARFQSWLASKLDTIREPAIRAPVEQFATWHHLHRLRRNSASGQTSHGPTHSARQETSETIKFLTWLHETHHRTAATCRQQDIDEWLATGPTTRTKIRTFIAWTHKSKINTALHLDAPHAKNTRLLTQDQRLAWIRELLIGDTESLPYRIAGTLLLLYAQPLMKIVALPTAAITINQRQTRISLGAEPVPVPEPFAELLNHHLHNRPNLRTAGGSVANPWLFPGHRAGKHLDPHTMMMALRTLGIDLLGARNSALQNLVAEIPPPVVAHLLGYSHNCTQRHAQLAGQPWSRYPTATEI
ncbi:recombinase XerD [Mycobacterium sp. 852014-52144_SCH5372336]|uniref:recombinase XerD n=1 Tax=Mycobacterium sp. 852014-52144_SCH5372336 TaxID=1834115 RepID=UPI000801296F|nr:recombinase XerD [Mycobacterium sp. 852014-52144_SCH5372336]OBB74464.1 recombinase XerD [Mycobacterium sp. 852014-52144_SCH5372336]